jgi:hypothetical protein
VLNSNPWKFVNRHELHGLGIEFFLDSFWSTLIAKKGNQVSEKWKSQNISSFCKWKWLDLHLPSALTFIYPWRFVNKEEFHGLGISFSLDIFFSPLLAKWRNWTQKLRVTSLPPSAHVFFFKLSWACWIGLCTLGPHKPTHFCKGNACDWSVSKIAQKKLKFWHLLLPTILYGLS